MRRFPVRKIPPKLPMLDDVGALRRHALIVVGEGAQSLAVLDPRVGDHVDDFRRVAQRVELVERQETRPREIRFLPEHAIQLDRMPNGLVDLQPELAAPENQRPRSLRALRRTVQLGGLLRNLRSMLHQIERLDQLVALQRVLPAKAVGIRPLLDFVALETRRRDAAPGNYLALMNPRSDGR